MTKKIGNLLRDKVMWKEPMCSENSPHISAILLDVGVH